jgi:uncharacterized protein YihD (DUF1040 family)
MRDPARIDKVLDIISRIWKNSPDMRLMQIFVNAGVFEYLADGSMSVRDPYFIEDSVLLEILEKTEGLWEKN